jgi:uncharacterized protein YjbI with pentapeptide repeats
MLKDMTHSLRQKIGEYKKAGMDISELIRGINIKGEDLSYAVISELAVPGQDISGANFTASNVKLIANGARCQNCRFIRTQFLQGSSLRGADCRRANFYEASGGYLDYSYSDMRGANICGATFSFASRLGRGAKVSENILDLLKKWWDIVPGDPMVDMKE